MPHVRALDCLPQPIFIWEDGKIVTLSPDDASKAVTVALAPGTVLERSLCHRQAITWLHKSNEPLVEYIVPEMSKPRLLPKGEVRKEANVWSAAVTSTRANVVFHRRCQTDLSRFPLL